MGPGSGQGLGSVSGRVSGDPDPTLQELDPSVGNPHYGSERCGIFGGISHIIPSHTLPRYDIEGGHIRSLIKVWSRKLLVSSHGMGNF